jgi:hypothetical protein
MTELRLKEAEMVMLTDPLKFHQLYTETERIRKEE